MENNQIGVPSQNVKKPRKKLKIILTVVGIVAVALVGGFGFLSYQASKVGPQVEPIIIKFIQYVNQKDYQQAYDLYAPAAKTQMPIEKFNKATTSFASMFAGIQRVSQTGYNYHIGKNTTFIYRGETYYADGSKGRVEATFVKSGGSWGLTYITIHAPVK